MVRKRALIISINPLLFQFKTQEFQAEMKSLLLMIFGNQEDKPSQEIFQKVSWKILVPREENIHGT